MTDIQDQVIACLPAAQAMVDKRGSNHFSCSEYREEVVDVAFLLVEEVKHKDLIRRTKDNVVLAKMSARKEYPAWAANPAGHND